ncbi:MAG: hypothetical protein MJ252_12430 [archaeon]|nr:hypothetical protein [archaeon]
MSAVGSGDKGSVAASSNLGKSMKKSPGKVGDSLIKSQELEAQKFSKKNAYPTQIDNYRQSKSTLEVIIEKAEFKKPFNYFVMIKLDGNEEKRRTRVSKKSANPQFEDNKFYLPLAEYDLVINQSLIFSAFVVVDDSNASAKSSADPNAAGTGQAKLLGENLLELGLYTNELTNVRGDPHKVIVELYRKVGAQNAIVGKLYVSLKLLDEVIVRDDLQEKTMDDQTQLLPAMEFTRKFVWRLRVHVRSAVNLPFNTTTESKMPSAYVEIGWTMYENSDINQADAVRTPCIDNNRSPIWNQELLFYPPPTLNSMDGFITLLLKDRYQMIPIQRATFSLNCLRPFHPVHLDLKLQNNKNLEEGTRSHLYVSFTLEDTPVYKLSEAYANVIVNAINFDPLPLCTDRCNIIMTTDKYRPPDNVYLEVEMKSRTHLASILNFHKEQGYSCFLSNTLYIPPRRLKNEYGALTNFIFPMVMMEKDLTFFIMVRDGKTISNHSMPNVIAGEILIPMDMLKTSYFDKNHSPIPFKTNWLGDAVIYDAISHSRLVVECSARQVMDAEEGSEEVKGPAVDNTDYDKVKENIIKKAMDNFTVNLASIPEKEKWDVLSKELGQKQELIHRMMKEVDEKNESLKLTGSEILELRKQIKMLQGENAILRKRLGQEEQMQIEAMVTQEIHKMSLPELKSKIIKLAQAYRGERMRNEEFEKALKQAQNEIANARKIANDLENLQKVHEEDSNKFLNLQKETQKIGLYRETIKKQEEVIVKMEGLLKRTMNESERQKDSLLELEQLRTENLKLQKELKDMVVNSTPGVIGRGNAELEKSKKEIERLQTLVNELQEDLRNKRPISAEKKDLQNEILQLEVNCHKAQARIKSLEEELESTTRNNAKEIAALKMILAEKEALIENMRMENAI